MGWGLVTGFLFVASCYLMVSQALSTHRLDTYIHHAPATQGIGFPLGRRADPLVFILILGTVLGLILFPAASLRGSV